MHLPSLEQAWRALLPAHVEGSAGAEPPPSADLFPVERRSLGDAGEHRLREFTAGRWHARRALAALGVGGPPELPRLADGAPAWPPGVVGSLAHTHHRARPFVISAVASETRYAGLGVDVEAPGGIAPRVWESFLSPQELDALMSLPIESRPAEARLRWSAKEAAFKAYGGRIAFDALRLSIDRPAGRFVTAGASGEARCTGRVVVADDWVFAVAWLGRDRAGGAR